MDLLFAHWDDGSPMLDHVADPGTAAAQARPVPRPEQKGFLASITAEASNLERQRWAIVTPAGAEGTRLEALVQPLVRARAEEQQADVLSIRVPPGMDTAAATAWKKDVFPALYGEEEAERPSYLLILGDLDQVSLDTQQVLAQDGFPGRLAFATDDGYGAYVDKVLAWQREPARQDRARALFYTVHDGTTATTVGHAKLITPCHDLCARAARDKPREFPASAVQASGAQTPNPDELRALTATRHPSVLLSMSHGLGPPRRRTWSPAEAREHQGAMSFGGEGALTAQDVASAPFLPGGLWIYFACFGAGTPRTSAYKHWLEMLALHGMADLGPASATLRGLDQGGGFVSGLAKAALANPNGPLAILGHIDLAWSYGYEELRVGNEKGITGSNRSRNFYNLITKLVAGERAGAASLAMKLVLGDVSTQLNDHYDRYKRGGTVEGATPADALALGNLWMLHQDLRGYALLGDPAVRLPLARQAHARTAPADSSATRDPISLSAGDHRAGIDAGMLDRLEQAALAIAGGESPGVIAAKLGVPRSEVVEAAKVYRDAGRAALSALLGSQEKGRVP